MPLPISPDWLTKRAGTLTQGIRPEVLFVMLGGQPQYRLDARPAGGQFICNVTQTANGKPLDGDGKYATPDAALEGGLEALRAKLGW